MIAQCGQHRGPDAVGFVDQVCANFEPGTTAVIAPFENRDASTYGWLTMSAVEGWRSAGCDCCRVRLDVVEGLYLLASRRSPPERVIVVLGPDDDISVATQTLLSDPDMQRLFELDGVITTVDAVALSTRLGLDLPLASTNELERLAVADRILVVRGDEVTDDSLYRVLSTLRTVGQFGLCGVPSVLPIRIEKLVDLHAWHGFPSARLTTMTQPIVLECDVELPTTVTCAVEGTLDPDAVEAWLDEVVAVHAKHILRLQGAVSVFGQDCRVCFHGVRSYASSHSEVEHHIDRRSTKSLIAVVGYGLDVEAIQRGFQSLAQTEI